MEVPDMSPLFLMGDVPITILGGQEEVARKKEVVLENYNSTALSRS